VWSPRKGEGTRGLGRKRKENGRRDEKGKEHERGGRGEGNISLKFLTVYFDL